MDIGRRSLRLGLGGANGGGARNLETGHEHHMMHKVLSTVLLYLRLVSIISFVSKITFCPRKFY